jgi:uncharacterized YigZ family protein
MTLSGMGEHADAFAIPARESRIQHVVVNSRFIATIGPAEDTESARGFIARIKAEFADASHNVPAFIIGSEKSFTDYCSDDGEPAGTAGRPTLAVLRGSSLGNVALVITRYFGGTKLGKGGLVKAYTATAQLAVNAVPRARKVKVYELSLGLPYSQLERIRIAVKQYEGEVKSENFSDLVKMRITIPLGEYSGFQNRLREISAGQMKPEIVAMTEILIPFSDQT